MKKSFILILTTMMASMALASTAVINFSGKTSNGTTCSLDKVLVENLTQGWSQTADDASLSIEIQDNEVVTAVDEVLADNDFQFFSNLDGKTSVAFNMINAGQVSAFVYDVTGRCVCQSISEQAAGYHVLNLEFCNSQMYYLHISTPEKAFSHSILNLLSGSSNRIQYVVDINARHAPMSIYESNICKTGDRMKYTGYTTIEGKQYTATEQQTIKEGNSEIVFVFDIPEDGPRTITVAEAVTLANAGDEGTYNIVGYVTSIQTEYSSQYDNQSFYIADTKNGGKAFLAWRVKCENLQKTIPVGSKIQINEAKLKVYNSEPETDAGFYFIILEMGEEQEESEVETITVSQAVSLAKSGDNGKYNIVGYVTSIYTEYNSQYDNQSFYMADTKNGGNVFLAWRVKSETLKETVEVGSKVQINEARIKTYNGIYETDAGFYFVVLEEQQEEDPEDDIIIPDVPSGLNATPISTSSVKLTWNASKGAIAYKVYRGKDNGLQQQTYSALNYANENSYVDSYAIDAGTRYYYRVSAIGKTGQESELCNPVSVLIPSGGGTTTLAAPTGVKATVSSSDITVSWNSVTGASKYNIYRSTSSSGSYSKVATEYGTSHTDFSLSAGTYYYKVAAVASDGTEGTKSSAASATIGGGGGGTTTLAAPTNVKAAYISGTHAVQVTWEEPALADSYEIYRSTTLSSNGTKITTVTSSGGAVYVDKLGSATDQITYYYRVKAKSSYLSQTSDFSDYAYVYVDKNPVAPCPVSNLKVSGSSSLKFTWDIQTQSGCGNPSERYIQFYDYSKTSGDKWVTELITSDSYTLSSSKVNQYTNSGSTLAGCVKLVNAHGVACVHFEYNTNSKSITILSTNCYDY